MRMICPGDTRVLDLTRPPFTRISPDHGPNVSMLGKNISNPKSLVSALKFFDNK